MDRTILRPLQFSDLVEILGWRNSEKVRLQMLSQHKITMAEHLTWFKRNSQNPSKILLVAESNSKSYGFAQLTIKEGGKELEWGFYTNPEAPKGFGLMLGKNVISYAFSKIKVDAIIGKVLTTNIVSIAFHLKLGFLDAHVCENVDDKILRVLTLTRRHWKSKS